MARLWILGIRVVFYTVSATYMVVTFLLNNSSNRTIARITVGSFFHLMDKNTKSRGFTGIFVG